MSAPASGESIWSSVPSDNLSTWLNVGCDGTVYVQTTVVAEIRTLTRDILLRNGHIRRLSEVSGLSTLRNVEHLLWNTLHLVMTLTY